MGNDVMDLEQLASFLGRDARELGKLANRGHLPGRKVAGQWRFAAAEIHHWVERQMPGWSDKEHHGIDPICPSAGLTPFISSLIPADCIDINLAARTKNSVIRELVKLASQSHLIWDPVAIRESVEARESRGTTAAIEGFALPHPHRRLPQTLSDSVIAFARTGSGIPFGAERGGLTDLYFLVCCAEDRQHLRVLSRLSRILRRPGFAAELRAAESCLDVRRLIESAETALSN